VKNVLRKQSVRSNPALWCALFLFMNMVQELKFQVLVDMQSMVYQGCKWIMVYQDHFTKFCVLRPLQSKRAAEVAMQLMDIFLLLGAPVILQSDNGAEFTASVIEELKLLLPDPLLIHGKPRHPQSQGSVERLNCDIKDMLVAWLADNQSEAWPNRTEVCSISEKF